MPAAVTVPTAPKGWSPAGTYTGRGLRATEPEPQWYWCPTCWGAGAIWHPLTKTYVERKPCEACAGVGSIYR